MADEKTKRAEAPADLEAIMQRLDLAEAKLAAQEDALNNPQYEATPESVTKAKKRATLSGKTFKVGNDKYSVKYPVIHHDGKNITEEDIIADSELQKQLISKHPGVLTKITTILLLLFAFMSSGLASSVTITANGAEVVATGYTTRELYPLQDLLIITKTATDAFEIQIAETRSKVWGGDIDSVTISGASTAGDKWAFLSTLMLQASTTNGYIAWIGRNNLNFYFKTSTNRLDVKYGSNRQPLWFGHIDSLKANRTSVTMAYLRLINRYKAQDCLPSTSVATIAAGAAAGSSPTVAVTGDAFSGSISVTTGTSATTGTLATVTLKITAPTGTRITLCATGDNSTAHVARVKAAGTTTTLVLSVPATALSDATAYTWNYTVVPY